MSDAVAHRQAGLRADGENGRDGIGVPAMAVQLERAISASVRYPNEQKLVGPDRVNRTGGEDAPFACLSGQETTGRTQVAQPIDLDDWMEVDGEHEQLGRHD